MDKDKIKEILQALKPVIGKKAERLWKMYLLADTGEEKAEIAQAVKLLADKHLDTFNIEQINLIPPKQNEVSGSFKLGEILYGANARSPFDFSLKEKDWIRHIGIFGSTGAGKTTVVYNLLKQLIDQDKPFLILDWKRDYRDLLKLPEFKDKVLVFTVGRDVAPFRFNPKEKPPGVDENVWGKKLLEIINHAYFLGFGAEDVIRESMHFETFGEMQQFLNKQQKRGRELLWWASAKRTMTSINYPGLAEVVNSKSFNIPNLLGKKVILELDGLSDSDKIFLIGSLMQWIYYYRMAQPDREVWKHTIFLEEAHHLLLKQPASQPENYADSLIREVRVFGQAIVAIDQRPSKLSDSALANINTKICLGLNHSQDITAMSNALLLNSQQKSFIGMLKIGQAIIKSQRITFPFLTQLPDFPIKKGIVSDSDVSEHMKDYIELSEPIKAPSVERSTVRSLPKDEIPPSPMAKIMLQSIAEQPFVAISARYKQLGMTIVLGNKAKDEIVRKGFAVPVTVNRMVLLELTHKGLALTKKWGINQKVRGNMIHNYWLEQVRQKFMAQEGMTFLEKDNIDLVVVNLKEEDETITAIQFETGKSNIKKNIKTLKDYNADKKFIITTTRMVATRIKEMLSGKVKDSITVMFVKDFLSQKHI